MGLGHASPSRDAHLVTWQGELKEGRERQVRNTGGPTHVEMGPVRDAAVDLERTPPLFPFSPVLGMMPNCRVAPSHTYTRAASPKSVSSLISILFSIPLFTVELESFFQTVLFSSIIF